MNPLNLFRITWHNEPVARAAALAASTTSSCPSSLTGVDARIIVLVGKWFPTGAHKVGAAFGCLVPRLVTGQFDPTTQKAVWPSTGNFCRGGAYDSALLGCQSIAILPEGMSKERFEWLAKIAGEVIATPGHREQRQGNLRQVLGAAQVGPGPDDLQPVRRVRQLPLALRGHRACDGRGAEEGDAARRDATAASVSATGSAGTIASGDYLKQLFPDSKIVASEALQCPTLLRTALARTASRASATSTCPGSTTSRTPTW